MTSIESSRLTSSSVPVQIRRKETGLEITWSTGQQTVLPSEFLRKSCPCATCLEARGDSRHQKPFTGSAPTPAAAAKSSLLKVVSATEDESLNLAAVWAVGNYALGMRWGDKHDTGIFTFEQLRDMANDYVQSGATS